MTSKRRRYVALTSVRHHVLGILPLNLAPPPPAQYSKPSYAFAITSSFYLERPLDLKENQVGLPGMEEGGVGGGGEVGARGGGSSFAAVKQENFLDVSGLY